MVAILLTVRPLVPLTVKEPERLLQPPNPVKAPSAPNVAVSRSVPDAVSTAPWPLFSPVAVQEVPESPNRPAP